jgi:hypothetical protein
MLYASVVSVFQSNDCKLLTTEEEHASLMQTKKIPKLKYVASCGHEHSVHYNVFKSRNTGVICPSCCCKKNGELKNFANQLHPMPMSMNHFNEERCIDYFIDIIKSEYDCKKTFEGCLADLTVKPKNQPNDSWLQIQVKTNAFRLRTYGFHNSKKYNDCLVLCICWEDKKMWIFDGNCAPLSKMISIGFNKSKYDVNECTHENIIEKLNHYYDKKNLFKFEESNSPICHLGKKEMEFKQLRMKSVMMCNFIDVSNYLHHDFMIASKKVQEKIGTRKKNANALIFKLTKSNGKMDKVRKFISYEIGDNDLYWLHFPDKKHFYLLPETDVMDENGNIRKYIYISLCNETQTPKNKNWNKYLFKYDDIDYVRLSDVIK